MQNLILVWTKGIWYPLHCIAHIWWYNWSTSAHYSGKKDIWNERCEGAPTTTSERPYSTVFIL